MTCLLRSKSRINLEVMMTLILALKMNLNWINCNVWPSCRVHITLSEEQTTGNVCHAMKTMLYLNLHLSMIRPHTGPRNSQRYDPKDDHNLVIHGFAKNTDLETVPARKNTGPAVWAFLCHVSVL